MVRLVFGGTRIVRLTMRFCLAPTSSSPSTMSTWRGLSLTTCSSGTRPASDTSVTRAVPAATASVSVSYHGSGAGWRRSGEDGEVGHGL